MSWISKNYEKAILSGAIVSALGLGFLGINSLSKADEDFSMKASGPGTGTAGVKGADRVSTAMSSLSRQRLWSNADFDDRPVDLFTGIPLFVNKNDKTNPVDLVKSPEVHQGIPNRWWLDNRLDPGYSDSPLRDKDGDGFSNKDEYAAQTDPSDRTSYPNLIGKVRFLRAESFQLAIRPGLELTDGAMTFEVRTSKGVAKVTAVNPVPKGDTFFKEAKIAELKNRFRFLGFEKKKGFDEQLRTEVDVTMVKIADLKVNKLGAVYEVPAMFRQSEWNKHAQYDRTAVLSLEALGMAGQEIRVEENTEFTLPPDGKGKKFKMTTVTPEQIIILEELGDGKSKQYVIAKGALGVP